MDGVDAALIAIASLALTPFHRPFLRLAQRALVFGARWAACALAVALAAAAARGTAPYARARALLE